MPPSSSRTHFRQRPYRKRRPRAVGSDLKGCVLWLLPVHPSDLVHASCEGASKTSRGDCENWEREEDPTILLLLGRDDLVLSACLNKSALPSDIDTPTWSNRASLRVRFTEGISSQSGRWMLSALVRVLSVGDKARLGESLAVCPDLPANWVEIESDTVKHLVEGDTHKSGPHIRFESVKVIERSRLESFLDLRRCRGPRADARSNPGADARPRRSRAGAGRRNLRALAG